MKTTEEILTSHGLWNYADNIKLSRQKLIELMDEYAVQFMNIKECHQCKGTGIIEGGIVKCMNCSGQGKIIYLPIKTTT